MSKSKIVLEKGSWGDYSAFVDGEEFKTGGVLLDRAVLLERVLASMGIEVVTKWHYYLTEVVDGKERGVRVDLSESNMDKKL